MKTVRVALVLCLNIGTDPPDVVKTSPCARDECWIKTCKHDSSKNLKFEMLCRRTCPTITCDESEQAVFELQNCRWICSSKSGIK